jgi:hypothetical protein
MYAREFYLPNVKLGVWLEENKNGYLIFSTMQYKINVQVLPPSRNAIKEVASCDYVILRAMEGKGQ